MSNIPSSLARSPSLEQKLATSSFKQKFLDDIPLEIWENIICQLPRNNLFKNVNALSRVCVRFNYIVRGLLNRSFFSLEAQCRRFNYRFAKVKDINFISSNIDLKLPRITMLSVINTSRKDTLVLKNRYYDGTSVKTALLSYNVVSQKVEILVKGSPLIDKFLWLSNDDFLYTYKKIVDKDSFALYDSQTGTFSYYSPIEYVKDKKYAICDIFSIDSIVKLKDQLFIQIKTFAEVFISHRSFYATSVTTRFCLKTKKFIKVEHPKKFSDKIKIHPFQTRLLFIEGTRLFYLEFNDEDHYPLKGVDEEDELRKVDIKNETAIIAGEISFQEKLSILTTKLNKVNENIEGFKSIKRDDKTKKHQLLRKIQTLKINNLRNNRYFNRVYYLNDDGSKSLFAKFSLKSFRGIPEYDESKSKNQLFIDNDRWLVNLAFGRQLSIVDKKHKQVYETLLQLPEPIWSGSSQGSSVANNSLRRFGRYTQMYLAEDYVILLGKDKCSNRLPLLIFYIPTKTWICNSGHTLAQNFYQQKILKDHEILHVELLKKQEEERYCVEFAFICSEQSYSARNTVLKEMRLSLALPQEEQNLDEEQKPVTDSETTTQKVTEEEEVSESEDDKLGAPIASQSAAEQRDIAQQEQKEAEQHIATSESPGKKEQNSVQDKNSTEAVASEISPNQSKEEQDNLDEEQPVTNSETTTQKVTEEEEVSESEDDKLGAPNASQNAAKQVTTEERVVTPSSLSGPGCPISLPSVHLSKVIGVVVGVSGGIFLLLSAVTFGGLYFGNIGLVISIPVAGAGGVVGLVMVVAGGLLFAKKKISNLL